MILWVVGGLAAYLAYRYAVTHGVINPVFGPPTLVVVDIELYAPDSVRNQVFSALTTQGPTQIMALGSQLAVYYPAAAYSLQHRAWQLLGGVSSGQPEPQPPSDAQEVAAQAAWTAAQVNPTSQS